MTRIFLILLAVLLALCPRQGAAAPLAYAPFSYVIVVTTAYASADPFPNRIDRAFTELDTGFVNIANAGASSFTGTIGIVANSAFAGDLSYAVPGSVLAPGDSVSLAIPDDASNVGGFNGPAYTARPGVELYLDGSLAGLPVFLMVADAAIHSGILRTDPYGLVSDSFVLQGGDPWGFDTGDPYELKQAYGTFVFQGTVAEPSGLALFLPILLLVLLPVWRARCRRRNRPRPA